MPLYFYNPSVIDPRAITTLGVNAKSGSAIGFFGTGLKYSIASILRMGGMLRIITQSAEGGTTYSFTTTRETIRDKEFHFIHMETSPEGQEPTSYPLGFTTELGKSWKPWMIFRELYSNAMDENGDAAVIDPLCTQVLARWSEWTLIEVQCPQVEDIWNERDQYFISPTRKPLWENDRIQVFAGRSSQIFYRGIAAGDMANRSMFTYNILERTALTEDRTLGSFWQMYRLTALGQCNDPAIARSILQASQNDMDILFTLPPLTLNNTSKEMQNAAVALFRANRTKASRMFHDLALAADPELRKPKTLSVSQSLEDLLSQGKLWLEAKVSPVDYKIEVVESLGDGTIAQALREEGVVYLTPLAFQSGRDYLFSTMLEEHLHMKHGFADCSRTFQDYLINQLARLLQHNQSATLR